MTAVAFACVGEDRGGVWDQRPWNVVFSVRSFGGALAGAPFHVFVADSASRRLRDLLAPLDATISVVQPWQADYRLANKLRMFEAVPALEADIVIALDCDVAVLGDLTPLIDLSTVRALPAEHDRLAECQWLDLYEHLGLDPPADRVVMTHTGASTFPYYNTGVVFVPTDLAGGLFEAWDGCLRELLQLDDRLPDPSKAEQRAFGLAVQRAGLPMRRLPLAANWTSKKARVPDTYAKEVQPPFVLHYHHKLGDGGFLWRPQHRTLRPLAQEFNQRRADAVGLTVPRMRRRPLWRRVRGSIRATRARSAAAARIRRVHL